MRPSAASARPARPMARLGGERRFGVRRHAEGPLQGRGATVHNAGPDHRLTLELLGQGFQEGVPLSGMNWCCGGLDGGEFGIVQAQRHGQTAPGGRFATMAPRGLQLQEADEDMRA